MKKRSKKRIPQDIKPWVGVKVEDSDIFALPGKKTTRWVAGGRRDWNTRVLNTAVVHEHKKIIFSSLAHSLGGKTGSFAQLLSQKLKYKIMSMSKTASLAKYKNFCLVSGRGRTYSRSLYLARHNIRKLIGVGAISGLNK